MPYPDSNSKSAKLYKRATNVLPDGGSRSTIRLSPYNLFIVNAEGKTVTDADGNSYTDYNNNYTSLIHGHSHPTVTAAVADQIGHGTAFAFGTEVEIKLAELLCERSPGFDQIRFMNSGSEAVMNAIKAARAFTEKPKIAKCENFYHGSYDYAEVSLGVPATDLEKGDPPSLAHTLGTPQGLLDDVVVIPFNNVEVAERILEEHADSLAGILIDPAGIGFTRVLPTQAFMDMLVRFRGRHGTLLIFDEVVAFRAGYAGSQALFDVEADLTPLGKIIGGGFPVGAVAGRKEVMDVFSTRDGRSAVPHGGTFNANPVTMAAGLAAMEMMTPEAFDQLNALGDAMRHNMRQAVQQSGVEAEVQGHYSHFALRISDPKLSARAFAESKRGVATPIQGLQRHMLNNGIFLSSGMMGVLSTVNTEEDIDPFCQTLLDGLNELTS